MHGLPADCIVEGHGLFSEYTFISMVTSIGIAVEAIWAIFLHI